MLKNRKNPVEWATYMFLSGLDPCYTRLSTHESKKQDNFTACPILLSRTARAYVRTHEYAFRQQSLEAVHSSLSLQYVS